LIKGFKTLIINKDVSLEYKDGTIVINDKDLTDAFAVSELSVIIINSLNVVITAFLMNELIKANVKIIFCNEKHNPSAEIMPYFNNCRTSLRLQEQLNITDIEKQNMWTKIVIQKINNQIKLLKKLGFDNQQKLKEYADTVTLNDASNREGQASRMYFNQLFGPNFVRDRKYTNTINSALNYGYSIILSHINRIVTACGYNTSIGLKHCNGQNNFNLSCDFIEPFRIFVDYIVYENQDKPFDNNFKKILIDNAYTVIKYGYKKYELFNAIECYATDIMKNIKNLNYKLKEINFI
jgi:CRISPR-associated endonuclease Cas1 subtype II